jgi:hypothetical protein
MFYCDRYCENDLNTGEFKYAPLGGRWWRFKYRFAGKEKRISLGIYPDVGLKVARERLDASRKIVAAGIDPAAQRKAAKIVAATANADNTFEPIAREWFKLNERTWTHTSPSRLSGFERVGAATLERVFCFLAAVPAVSGVDRRQCSWFGQSTLEV